MKTLGKLKLNALNKAFLDEKELNLVRGGAGNCTCGCLYADYGGSKSADNDSANDAYDYHSVGYDPDSKNCTCGCAYMGLESRNANDHGQDMYSWGHKL